MGVGWVWWTAPVRTSAGGDDSAWPLKPVMVAVNDLVPYDDLDEFGDDGWDVQRLLPAVAAHGILKPLEVAHSAVHLARGDQTVFVFNGIHRLHVARLLAMVEVPVLPAVSSEDAVWPEGIFGG